MDPSLRSRLPTIGLWIATAWASSFALIVILEGLDPEAPQVEEGQEWEVGAVIVVVMASLVAVALSWWRRPLMVRAMLAAGLLGAVIGIITAGQNHWMAVLVAGGPYLLAAALARVGRVAGR